METVLDRIYRDIPQQFHTKKNIEVIFKSYSRQIEELLQVFDDLDNKTTLENAIGTNLDYVGSIVNLSRKEAGLLAGINVEDPVISDERYRKFLKYKVLANTNECTYDDLMDGLAILWDVSPIYYIEDEALPAVIILTMPFLTPGGKVVKLGEVPMVKASGVRIEFLYYIKAIIEVALNMLVATYSVPRCNTLVCGTYPKRAALGKIIAVECDNDAKTIIQAFKANPSGTVRIGGKVYDSTLGKILTDEVEIEINSKLQIVDAIVAGHSVAGTRPGISAKGLIVPQGIEIDENMEHTRYSLPLSGMQSIGGGALAESKFVSAKTEETEADVKVYVAAATIRRCGTANCGNIK